MRDEGVLSASKEWQVLPEKVKTEELPPAHWGVLRLEGVTTDGPDFHGPKVSLLASAEANGFNSMKEILLAASINWKK